jgi:hypothetical protein
MPSKPARAGRGSRNPVYPGAEKGSLMSPTGTSLESRPDTPFRPFRRRADNRASCPLRREGWTRTIKELVLTYTVIGGETILRKRLCQEDSRPTGFRRRRGWCASFSRLEHGRSTSRGAYGFAYWNDLLKRLQHFLCFFRSHLLPISAGLLFRQVRQESPFWIGPLVPVAG